MIKDLDSNIKTLEKAVAKVGDIDDVKKHAQGYRDSVIPAMNAVREPADELEKIVDADVWPLPSYAEMLFLK